MGSAVAQMLGDLQQKGGLQGRDIANVTRVSPASVSRWIANSASPSIDVQTLLVDLRYVVDRLADFYSPEETRIWLHARNAMLNYERAIDLIAEDRTKEVLEVIERLAAGVFI